MQVSVSENPSNVNNRKAEKVVDGVDVITQPKPKEENEEPVEVPKVEVKRKNKIRKKHKVTWVH